MVCCYPEQYPNYIDLNKEFHFPLDFHHRLLERDRNLQPQSNQASSVHREKQDRVQATWVFTTAIRNEG